VRGGEAIDMLQAMNTGHEGSLTTIHANSPRDALARLETMIQMAGLRLDDRAIRRQISSALDLVIQATRLPDGRRRITSVTEVLGIENDVVVMQEVFQFAREGVAANGAVLGKFRGTGVVPRFVERLHTYGLRLSHNIFTRG
jgi:pilus assembly protein CpaF